MSKRGVLRRWWRSLLREHADPRRLGLGVALGVVIGCTPFYGFQMLLAVALASLLRLNRISVLLGSQISMPPLTPFIVLGGAQLGELILHHRTLPVGLAEIRAMRATELLRLFVVDLGVGGLVLGGVLGLALGSATTWTLRRRQTHPGLPRLSDERLDALEDRAEGLPRKWRSYAWWKLRLDPVYAMALPHLSQAKTVLDLGAGMGLLCVAAALEHPGARFRAVEWDAAKARQARALAAGLPVEVEEADAHEVALGTPDAIALLDLLHYTSVARQKALLRRCARALAPGGVLVLRDLGEPGRWAERMDRLAVRLKWNRGAGVQAWSAREMKEELAAAGLVVEAHPAGRGPFRSNVLLVGRRSSAAP